MITGAFSFLHAGFLISPIIFILLWFIIKPAPSGLFLSPIRWFDRIPQSPRQLIGKMARWAIFILLLVALSIGAAAPVRQVIPDEDKARNVFLVIDTSISMREKDFYDGISADTRMQGVKKVVKSFIKQRAGDRIGIVVFGGRSFLLSPLTKDTSFLEHSIDILQPGIGGDGTALGDGLAVALQRLEKVEQQAKAIILVTDGASNAGIVQPNVAAKIAHNLGVKIHAIGIGDANQETYDEKTLKNIADITGGIFRNASDVAGLTDVTNEIELLIESLSLTPATKALWHYSKYFAWIGLLLFGLYCVVTFKFFHRIGTKQNRQTLLAPLAILTLLLCVAAYSPSVGPALTFDLNTSSFTTVIAVDLSASMNAADVRPTRLQKIKRDIIRAIRKAPNDGRKIALIGFAGSAQIFAPPTDDFDTITRIIESFNTDLISERGTNLTEAISVSLSLLAGTQGQIILITDGETDQKDDTLFISQSSPAPIFPLPVGTEQGALLQNTQISVTVDKELLSAIAQHSKGELLSEFSLVPFKNDAPLTNQTFTTRNEIGWAFLAAALAVMFVAQYGLKRPLFVPALLPLLLSIAMSSTVHADDISDYEGMKYYKNEEFNKAWEAFRESPPTEWETLSRQGATKFKLKEFSEAAEHYKKSLDIAKDPSQKFSSHYNLGNAYLAQNKLDMAIAQYDEALSLHADSIEAQTNREIALQRKQEQSKQTPSQNDKDNNESPEQQNQPQSNQNEEQNKDDQQQEQSSQEQNKNDQDSKQEQSKDQEPNNQPDSKKEDAQEQSRQQAKQWLNALPEAPIVLRQSHDQEAPQKGKQWW